MPIKAKPLLVQFAGEEWRQGPAPRRSRGRRRDGDNHGGKLSRTGERQPVRRGFRGSVQTEAIRNALVRFA